jgi:hypothetical protein
MRQRKTFDEPPLPGARRGVLRQARGDSGRPTAWFLDRSESLAQRMTRGIDATGPGFFQERGMDGRRLHHTCIVALRDRGEGPRALSQFGCMQSHGQPRRAQRGNSIVGREGFVVRGRWSVRTRWDHAMKLHHQPAHAESSGPVDRVGSPACRGWRAAKVTGARTAEEVEARKTNPIQANSDCHKFCCSIALKSFGASVGAKNEANARGCFLPGVGCLCRDGPG